MGLNPPSKVQQRWRPSLPCVEYLLGAKSVKLCVRGGGGEKVAQLVKYLPSVYKALGLTPSTI